MELVNYNLDANQISYLIKILLIGLGFLLQLLLSECLTLRALPAVWKASASPQSRTLAGWGQAGCWKSHADLEDRHDP